MSLILDDKVRRIIPRWRNSRLSLSSGELDGSINTGPDIELPSEFLDRRREDWESDHSIETAAELVASALVLGRPVEAITAARYLVTDASRATETVKATAAFLLSGNAPLLDKELDLDAVDEERVRRRVHDLRLRLHDAPRHSFYWVDLSRAYLSIGQPAPAERAMEMALRLAPNNRFVLRSAARLYVSSENAERALHVLRQSGLAATDPWILAADLAITSVLDRGPHNARLGERMINSGNFSDFQTSELASALATIEYRYGGIRKTRKLIRQSLKEPTENSVAQAGWMSRRLETVAVDPALLETTWAFEARAWDSYTAMKWADAVEQCEHWLSYEPFSSRPAALGSYVALATETDIEAGEALARRGLLANPKDSVLLNNLAVALAYEGRPAEAWEEFRSIDQTGADEVMRITLLATEGLLNFRRGNSELGRGFYLKAIGAAVDSEQDFAHALAAIHLLREEVWSGSPKIGDAVELAKRAVARVESPDVDWAMEKMLREVDQQSQP